MVPPGLGASGLGGRGVVLKDAFSRAKVDRCSALVSCNTAKGAWRARIPSGPPSDSLAAALVKSHGSCACGHLKQT